MTKFELKVDEFVLADTAGNLFRGVEAVGGRIKLTNHRLLFEPHAINLQKMPVEISLREVGEVRKRNTLWVIPNGLVIRLKSGVEYKFVLWNREKLLHLIRTYLINAD